jgi:Ni2+-binding GTPase involved in maturation of urease and hydrogenase
MASAGRRTHYEPPWGNASIIGVAGSSGSGKTSLALAIVASLNLPWVVILSMVREKSMDAWRRSRARITNTLCHAGLVLQAVDAGAVSGCISE